jgi:predicted amidohydrolase
MSRVVTIASVGPAAQRPYPGQRYASMAAQILDALREHLKAALCDAPDLVVLPENCNRPEGYDPVKDRAYFDEFDASFREMISGLAREHHANIVYPAYVFEGGHTFNAMQLFGRNGEIAGQYEKAYPTMGEIEDWRITPGRFPAELMRCDIGSIAGVICFDLNFNQLREHYAGMKPDLVVFSSMYHGGFKQLLWAYSCRAPFVGCIAGPQNRILLPTGDAAAASTNYSPYAIGRVNLDGMMFHLDLNEPRFAAMKRKYGAKVKVSDPGFLGSVYVTSETDEFTIRDMVREFGLEPLDDYFARATAMADARRAH